MFQSPSSSRRPSPQADDPHQNHTTADAMDLDPPQKELTPADKPENPAEKPSEQPPPLLNGSTTEHSHSTTPRLQTQQFPTTGDAILARANRKSRDVTSSAARGPLPTWFSITYEEVLREQTSGREKRPAIPVPATLAMPETILPPLRPPNPDLKRKRASEVEYADEAQFITPAAAAALAADRPARIVPKPLLRNKRTEDDGPRRCENCNSSAETPDNLLVACPVCDWSWHQRCHEPEIGAASVRDRARFKCEECVGEGLAIDAYRLDKLQQDQVSSRGAADVEKLRSARLAELPAFNKPELIGFKAGDADRETRRAYFSSLKRTDVINLLLFSDAIKDGLLIDVLVSMSKKHPNLPLFSHPDWAAALVAPTSLQRPLPPKARQPAKPVTKRPKTSAIRKVQETETIADQPDEEPLPGIWPEAGIGLYSKLPPEQPDPILLGQNDEEAFSGFMVDRNGRPVEPAFG